MITFFIKTLGCKVNQYESDGIAQELERQGFKRQASVSESNVIIVNTCAVTSKAGMQSRQAIRKLIRQSPDARVIVTGCHAQTDIEQVQQINGIHAVVCHNDKTRIATRIAEILENPDIFDFTKPDRSPSAAFNSFNAPVTGKMTRPYLKIQDGCNAFCTYCIVPYARGASVSMPEKEVLAHLHQLGASGYHEVILTGIHIGMYGADFKHQSSLVQLLEIIDREKPVKRVRLSSIEPGEVAQELIDMAAPGHILCDHFHIPLQSGDDEILKNMKRPYDTGYFKEMILSIRGQLPLAGIGVDVIVGFPGESEAQFEQTYQLIESLPVSYLHIFPFSPRKGTPAYHFKNKVSGIEIKKRCDRLRSLDQTKRQAFIARNLNTRLEGLIQSQKDAKTGLYKAVTSNYLNVLVQGGNTIKGKILDIVPEAWNSDLTIIGRIHT